jgi:hypothetical protein
MRLFANHDVLTFSRCAVSLGDSSINVGIGGLCPATPVGVVLDDI